MVKPLLLCWKKKKKIRSSFHNLWTLEAGDTWSRQKPEFPFQNLVYQNVSDVISKLWNIDIFHGFKKHYISAWKCWNECLHTLEPKDFSLLCCSESKYTFMDQFEIVLCLLEVLQCLMDLVAWSSSFLWTWLGGLFCGTEPCFSIFTTLTAVTEGTDSPSIWTAIIAHARSEVFFGQTKIILHLPGVVHSSVPRICKSASVAQVVGTSQHRHSSSLSERE